MLKGIDISGYQINVPFSELIKNAGLGFVIIKGDQLTATANHFALARAAGVPIIGMYLWIDPTSAASYLVNWFAKDIREYDPDFIWLDMEQWWADWGEYFDAIAGKIPWDKVRKLSSIVVSNHGQAVAAGLQKLFPNKKIGIYSATWFTGAHSPDMLKWIGKYPLWWAHYFDGLLGIRQVTWDYLNATPPQPFTVWMPYGTNLKWSIWQYSSTMITPAQYARYDWCGYDGDVAKMKSWINDSIEVKPMATVIHVESTSQKDRAKIIHWKPDQSLTVPLKDLDADAIVLTAAGMNKIINSQVTITSEDSFKARHAMVIAAGLPVIARVNLHSGYWTLRQYSKDTVLAQTTLSDLSEAKKQESIRQNLVIPKILSSLCDGEFNMDDLFSKRLKWLDVKLLDLLMVEMKGFKGENIGHIWHRAAFDHVTLGLNWLKLLGYIPNIPIAMLTTPQWLSQFNWMDPSTDEFISMINNSKTWLWLHLGKWTQFSTSTFKTATELWTTRPAETFNWTLDNGSKWYPPDGYGDRVLMHLYAEQQKLAGLPGSEVELNLWQDSRVPMLAFLGAPVIVKPPIDTSDKTLEKLWEKVDALEVWQTKIRGA